MTALLNDNYNCYWWVELNNNNFSLTMEWVSPSIVGAFVDKLNWGIMVWVEGETRNEFRVQVLKKKQRENVGIRNVINIKVLVTQQQLSCLLWHSRNSKWWWKTYKSRNKRCLLSLCRQLWWEQTAQQHHSYAVTQENLTCHQPQHCLK